MLEFECNGFAECYFFSEDSSKSIEETPQVRNSRLHSKSSFQLDLLVQTVLLDVHIPVSLFDVARIDALADYHDIHYY